MSLKFVLNGPIDNFVVLVQVMARRQTDDKPLPEPMLTQFTDAYTQHQGETSQWNTVGSCYNGVQHDILHASLWWLGQNIYRNLNPIKTPHILPEQVSYGCLCADFEEKLTALWQY